MRLSRLLLAAATLCTALSVGAQNKYKNPVYGSDFPDPSVVRAKDGTFYTYATGCKMLKSTNFATWTKQSDPLSRPTWNDSIKPDGSKDYYSMWACDVSYLDGKYYVQYASALWGNGYRTGIGVAVGDTPTKFTDKGKLFRSTEIGVWNSIDPCFYQEKDKKYIIWGSFHDICIAELEDDGLAVKNFKPINNPQDAGKQKRFSGASKIAGGAFEGPMIYKRGKYYYLFCSVGSCCEGANSTYKTVVGRSTSLKGPYVNKQGGDMKSDNYTTIIKGNDRWRGPGHNSEIITDDEGQDWLLYHCYDMNNGCNGRLLLLDKINWVNGWPEIEGGVPSSEEKDGPVFYTGDGANMTYKLDNADFSMSKFKYWNTSSTGDASMISSAGSNVFMPFARVTSVAGGATFDINQQLTGMKNGIYELRVKSYAKGENVDLCVNAAKTPVVNETTPPTSDATTSTRFLDGKYEQSAYGIVTNNKLTIGAYSSGELIVGDRFAIADVRIIFREKNVDAAKKLAETFTENVKRVAALKKPYYKEYLPRLNGYVAKAQNPESETERYNMLGKLQLTLDSLSQSIELYDSLSRLTPFMESEIKRGKETGFTNPEAETVLAEAKTVLAGCNYTDKEVKALIEKMHKAIHDIFYVFKKGDGTKENPYSITTPEQLDYMHEVLVKNQMVYFSLDKDVDMSNIEWKQLNGGSVSYSYWINFEGNGHIIFNLHNVADEKYYPSFFGTLCGECRNVGFYNANINGTNAYGSGIIAGSLGYSTFKIDDVLQPVLIENCYVTGKVTGKGYMGGIAGNVTSSPVTIRNVYSVAELKGDYSADNCVGGLVGRVRGELTIEKSYAAGTAEGTTVGGIIGGGQTSSTVASNYTQLFAWGKSVLGTTASALGGVREGKDIITDLFYTSEMSVNNVEMTDGLNSEDLRQKAKTWGTPWHENPYIGNNRPILKWQVERGDYKEYCGFDPATAIDGVPFAPQTKAQKNIYDLTGRQIAKPTMRGIYIIDGKKVIK